MICFDIFCQVEQRLVISVCICTVGTASRCFLHSQRLKISQDAAWLRRNMNRSRDYSILAHSHLI